MAYCRMTTSNSIYMFHHINGGIYCVNCDLVFYKRSDAISHLEYHLDEGKDIPQSAIDRLRQEIKDEGDDA